MTDSPSTTPDAGSSQANGQAGASPGQILIMFAIVLTSLLGAVGLAVDLGLAFSQRRTMQTAADAGALAGTRLLSKATVSSPKVVMNEVLAVVNKNGMNLGTMGAITCNYVTDDGSAIGNCNGNSPPNATGVEVTVQESHPTFFIKVIPGAANSVTTTAYARAHVQKLGSPRDGPYLPCVRGTRLASGGTMDLLIQQGNQWVVNPAAINQTFQIHGPQITDCDAKSDRFKGLADTVKNANLDTPGWFYYVEGDSAGTISADVEGPDGCKAGQEIVNCVVFLPLAINDPMEEGNNKQLWTVAFAPFYITRPKSNETHGKLLNDYIVYGKGQTGNYGWEQGYTGPITIRLTK
jgi:Flp pilus assembly protein TadG